MWRTTGSHLVRNNTIRNVGTGGAQTAAVFVMGDNSTVDRNVITTNGGTGVTVVGENPAGGSYDWPVATGNRISQNTFGSNAGLAIDLTESSNSEPDHELGDGVTLTGGTLATTGNIGVDAPVITSADTTTVAGTTCSACIVEVYRAIAGSGDTFLGTDYGEGVEYLGSAPASFAGNWSLTGITTLTSSDEVSALTIDAANNTSEFGANVDVNRPPVADAGGPYVIAEGDPLTVDGSGSTDPDLDTLTYAWDLDNDSFYDDATTVGPTIPWATLVGLGLDDDGGPFTIGLEVDDGNGGSDTDTATLTITNTAPTLTTTGPVTSVSGSLYTLTLGASDPGADTITSWVIDWGDGTVQPIAGNPPSVTHTYTGRGPTHNILAAATDEDGTHRQNDLLVTSWDNHRTIQYDAADWSGSALETGHGILNPYDVAVGPDGDFYVSAYTSNDVLHYDGTTGAYIEHFVTAVTNPVGLVFGPDGHLYVASYTNSSIEKFDGATGAPLGSFVTSGSGGITGSMGLTFGPDGNLYVASYDDNAVYRYNGTTGAFIDIFVTAGSGGLAMPEDLVFGPDGDLYVADPTANNVKQYDGTTGASLGVFTSGFNPSYTISMAFSPDGHMYVPSYNDEGIHRFDSSTGAYVDTVVSAGAGGLAGPAYVTFVPEQQVLILNGPPVADAGGPYVIAEGDPLTVDGSGSTDPDLDTLTYAWDLDNDTFYDDATTVGPTIPWATLVGLGLDDDGGPFTIGLEVDDGNGGTDTDTAQLTITNTPPDLTVTGSSSIIAGALYTVNLGVTDPGADTVTSWIINWGDGTVDTIAGNPATASHTYSRIRSYDVTAAVVDEDGTFTSSELLVANYLAAAVPELDGNTGDALRSFFDPALTFPLGVAVGPDGLLYTTALSTNLVVRFDLTTGLYVDTFVPSGSGGLTSPTGIDFANNGDLLVASLGTNSVKRYDATSGAYLGDFIPSGPDQVVAPVDLEFGSDGLVYVSSWTNSDVRRYNGDTGAFVDVFVSTNLTQATGLAFGTNGNLYVGSTNGASGVHEFDGTTGAHIAQLFSLASTMGVDFGPDGNVYVSTPGTNVVNVYDPTGTLIRTHSDAADGLNGAYMIDFEPDKQVAVIGLTVNSTGNASDVAAGDGACDTGATNSAGDPECTLAAAIEEVNAIGAGNRIEFAMPDGEAGYQALGPGASYWSIQPGVSLPAVTAPGTTIDGTTQTTFATLQGYDTNFAGPPVELDGSIAAGNGLEISADSIEIRGLVINRFDTGIAVLGGANSLVAGNYLGPDVTGLVGQVGNSSEGVYIAGATNTLVGGTTPADRNVVSGNRLRGVFVDDFTDGVPPISDGTVVTGNYIGTDAAGAAALPYDGTLAPQQMGIALWDGPDNTFGGPAAGERNVVSGNSLHGIYIFGPNSLANTIQGNVIGLDATLAFPVGNGIDNPATRAGIYLAGASGTLIGGPNGGGEANIIAGNYAKGIVVQGTGTGNSVLRNSIHDNANIGLDLGADLVTANDPGDIDSGANGLLNYPDITDASETAGTVTVDFELDVAAGDYRIEVFTNPSGADDSGFGEGETFETATTIAHAGSGVESFQITYPGAGTDIVTLTATEESVGPVYGPTSEFSAAVTAGTALVNSTGNSGDANPGDHLCDTGASNSELDAECTLRAAIAEANASAIVNGVEFAIPVTDPGHSGGTWTISVSGTEFGGLSQSAAIDARTQPGYAGAPVVNLDGSGLIGTATGFIVGPTAPATTIAGFSITEFPGDGILTTADTTLITDNYIGVWVDGATAAGNNTEGVVVTGAASGVVISNNLLGDQGAAAITLNGTATATVITGNIIGTDIGLTFDLGNGQAIWADTSGSAMFGGDVPADANIVRHSAFDALELYNSGPGISVLGNSISDNVGHGIDLEGDGPTPNDPGDPDAGANDLLNFPDIGNVQRVGANLLVDVSLDAPAGDYRIELFGNTVADVSGFGEGTTFLGAATVTHTGSGPEPFALTVTSPGTILTATATEESLGPVYGATSEFSLAVPSPDLVIVNSTGDASDLLVGDGQCDTGATNSQGNPECTFRAAIEEANNATSPVETIWFRMPVTEAGHSAGVWTISPTTGLATVTDTTRIDGTTQTGYMPNTLPALDALDGTQVVVIDGSGAGVSNGLTLDGDNISVEGLTIGGFNGHGIEVNGNTAILSGLYVGTDASGTGALANTGNGLHLTGDDISVGGFPTADRVLISGNGGQGIDVSGASTVVVNSIVGLDASATTPLQNGLNGIRLFVATDATIGVNSLGNIVAGNDAGVASRGIFVTGGSGHTIEANLVGTNLGGDVLGNFNAGISVADATGVVIGGATIGEENVVAHNGGDGVQVTGAGSQVTILANSIAQNSDLSIDLAADGTTSNDPGDADSGPNDLLNTPVLGTASVADGLVTLDYLLDVPAGNYRIEFFADPLIGALVGVDSITHAGAGPQPFSAQFAGSVGDTITSTTTVDLGATFGPTSEHSSPVIAVSEAANVVEDASIRRSDVAGAGGLSPASAEVPGIAGRAFDLDGFNDRFVGPGLDIASTNLSLSAWIRPDSVTGDPRIVSKMTSSGTPIYELYVDSGTSQAAAAVRVGGTTITAQGGTVSPGTWAQVAATWDGVDLVVFVDGAEVARTPAVGSLDHRRHDRHARRQHRRRHSPLRRAHRRRSGFPCCARRRRRRHPQRQRHITLALGFGGRATDQRSGSLDRQRCSDTIWQLLPRCARDNSRRIRGLGSGHGHRRTGCGLRILVVDQHRHRSRPGIGQPSGHRSHRRI